MHAYETEALATEVEAETRAFSHFSVETEDKTKTFSLNSQAVTRPRRLKFQLRRDRAEGLLRLETASVDDEVDHQWLPDWTLLLQQTSIDAAIRLDGVGHLQAFVDDRQRCKVCLKWIKQVTPLFTFVCRRNATVLLHHTQ